MAEVLAFDQDADPSRRRSYARAVLARPIGILKVRIARGHGRSMKRDDARDLIMEWRRLQAADLVVVDVRELRMTSEWRATVRTSLGRRTTKVAASAAAALRSCYTALGYARAGDALTYTRDVA